MQMEHLKLKSIMGKMIKACLTKPKKKRTCLKVNQSSETSGDGYIEQCFEVMFIFDKDISQINM